ncbi:MAG: hypothetical protein ACI9VT_004041 [Psychroserpens sp.]|jgi:hypothetical protein
MQSEVGQLYKVIIESSFDDDTKKQLLDEVRKLRPISEQTWPARWVIFALVVIAIAAPVAHIFSEYAVPDGILALSSAAVGALASFATSISKK